MSENNLFCLPILALRGLTIFPNTLIHFDVVREKSVNAINVAMDGNRRIFLVSQKDIRDEEPTPADLCKVGVIAKIHQVLKVQNNIIRVFVRAESRGIANNIVAGHKYIFGDITPCMDKNYRLSEARKEGLIRSCLLAFGDYFDELTNPPEDIFMNVQSMNNISEMADYIASNIPISPEQKQKILDELHPVKRMEELLVILKKETELLAVEREINEKTQERMEEGQREYFLREKLRVISEEIDGEENEAEEADEYNKKIDKLVCSDEIKERLYKEVTKLFKMPPGAHESVIIRNYLDFCTELPYDKVSEDSKDIKRAEKILERDHYGLKKVKERILEFLAAKIMNPDIKGQIICLVGPPGTGKTSIAKSVAEALNKEYVRISLGGIGDESEIRGHRKTYVGAMPGRIAEGLKKAGTSNPLMLLDEIDKLSADYKGDPASALLEALDGEQNNTFRDHFVEIPIDLSRVFFIATANTLDTIPAPLLDRMEVIELLSYTSEEKFHIAKNHLLPKQMKRHSLTSKNFKITDKALRDIIEFYVREAGVRKLEREIVSLCRKATKILVYDDVAKVTIKNTDLEKYLGAPKYKNYNVLKDEVGVTNGLAWTAVGGELLKIEVLITDGKGEISTTGSLGDIMKESAKIAVSYVRSISEKLGIEKDFYKKKDIHIHAPEGAVPKDGPSAGVTITTSLVSALLNLPVNSKVAMTGEITLTGKVLAIGGLREKTMAAYNNGIKTIIIPMQNKADLKDVEQVVKDNVEFVFADKVDTVLKTALSLDVKKNGGSNFNFKSKDNFKSAEVRI
jgi:ATP-dependent Lon protease